MELAYPIIEVRENNLFVLTAFDGAVSGAAVKIRHNLANNQTRFLIDSRGKIWEFAFQGTDNSGWRKLVSKLVWNISSDYYTCSELANATVGKFRKIIAPHQKSAHPDMVDMANALIESVAECAASDRLGDKIRLLNL